MYKNLKDQSKATSAYSRYKKDRSEANSAWSIQQKDRKRIKLCLFMNLKIDEIELKRPLLYFQI